MREKFIPFLGLAIFIHDFRFNAPNLLQLLLEFLRSSCNSDIDAGDDA